MVALGSYALLSYATLVTLGATLTLPGLAGFVLAIGMAIDANVLVFERAREEYAAGGRTSLRSAVTTGFGKAWSAIIDSNVTTLLAAGLLFFLASGPVRGFGVTLAIGVLASMVSALLITRVLADWAVRRRAVVARPGVTGIAAPGRVRTWLTARDPDLMKHGRQVARRLRGGAGAGRHRHRHPRPGPRGRVHRRPAGGVLDDRAAVGRRRAPGGLGRRLPAGRRAGERGRQHLGAHR